MKSIALLYSVASLSCVVVNGFVAPSPRLAAASLGRRSNRLTEKTIVYSGIQDTFNEAGKQADLLGSVQEDDPLTDDQLDVVFKLLEEIEGASPVERSTDETPPSLLILAIKLFWKEVTAGRVDLEWLSLVLTAAFIELAVKVFKIERVAEAAREVRKILVDAMEKAGSNSEMKYSTYGNHEEYEQVPLNGLMKKLDGVPPITYWFSLKKIIRVVLRLLLGQVGLAVNAVDPKDAVTEERYDDFFRIKLICGLLTLENPFLPAPLVSNVWDEDAAFARQFLNGVNPVMLRVVENVGQQLSPSLLDFFKADDTRNLEALAASKRLLYVSYEDLQFPKDTVKNPHSAYPEVYHLDDPRTVEELRYFSHAIVVLELSQDRQDIEVLAIELDEKTGRKVYSADTTDPDTWLFAKATAAAADSQFHEWVSHLGATHLAIEPHIIAIHNTLRKQDHRVFAFLKPMTRGVMLLNFAARETLAAFGPESFGDKQTSVGVGQFCQLILKYWEDYSFFESSALDRELASRGFDRSFVIPCYRYRTDGLKIWDAYEEFAKDFVDELYENDDQVQNDSVLQEWARETTDPNGAAIAGFPTSFDTKETLASTLQTLAWVCSGQHAAVNFPQYDYYGYQANKPLGIRKSMELFANSSDRNREWVFREAFPDLATMEVALSTVHLLTLPSRFTIDRLDDFFQEDGKPSYATFKRNLKEIGDDIDQRSAIDKKEGRATYNYLHPKNIPASIDI